MFVVVKRTATLRAIAPSVPPDGGEQLSNEVGAGASSNIGSASVLAWSAGTAWVFDQEIGCLVVHALPEQLGTDFELLRSKVRRRIRKGDAEP